ncbi:hypothetical protein KAM448_36960 [Aeromonas caviae]|uniref:Uncharacterized protein n=1 Tax=Aeromonas caviae TaxID=648 RepID=A0ABD0B9X9_AERCA|nr:MULTISPECIES: hypothetical protein [Aeromonas]MBW3798965.1 hypothetical protein [Aeromonas hydrophila]MBW3803758.1 hypothetical protein [Aeromonas hydrophila]MBW3821779.1 hypothetical protein [Aeromonas hydrophila]BCK65887.1 hypothetical protein KAM330_48760 [Aeromonas hydrophila]BCR31478.1 hypothetical protein KAM376_44840 [Aeromonas caviae]
MIQKNIYFPHAIGPNISLVAKARRMQLSELHDEIISNWLDATPQLPLVDCSETPDRLAVYLSEANVERLLQRLVDIQLAQHPTGARTRITESDLIRSALLWWLNSLDLDTPLHPKTTLDE